MTIELIPLEGLPEIEPGDDLASVLEPSLRRLGASEGDHAEDRLEGGGTDRPRRRSRVVGGPGIGGGRRPPG